MKYLLLIIAVLPTASIAQSKKKKLQIVVNAEKKANEALENNLKKHVQYLADDKLEGRRTGTKGEELAMQYIIKQYQQAGLQPKGTNGFVQAFTINEGKQIDAATTLTVNGKTLIIVKDYFPLNYSALGLVKGTAAMALNEPDNPWFRDVREWLEDNANNPHYNIDEAIKKDADKAAKKGATALFIY